MKTPRNLLLLNVLLLALLLLIFLIVPAAPATAQPADKKEKTHETTPLAKQLQELDARVLPEALRDDAKEMTRALLRKQLTAASRKSTAAWRNIESLDEWTPFRKAKLADLQASLGNYPDKPEKPAVHRSGSIPGDGFVIDNIVFRSRPGLWITANLYRPAEPLESMPGIVICHSHHTPKTHGELQDMGMTWARAGCMVLVMDQLGHGERRAHPFDSAEDYESEFRVSRQDYYFRYDNGIQLHLIGDSLIGWMAWDLVRGVDLLLSHPGVDLSRIILLGAVAGGGDPAAVAGALDERIACVVPFNFGGPQPETQYPLPENPADRFNYTGSGSWESTRNLRNSARDGFLPWVIVGSVAHRYLIYAHEFRWDRENDPVWDRLQTIWRYYGKPRRLTFTHGYGTLKSQNPRGSHCTHIGKVHRRAIHGAFEEWFDIEVDPEDEYSRRLPREELMVWNDQLAIKLDPPPLHEVLSNIALKRLSDSRAKLSAAPLEKRKDLLRREISGLLGPNKPEQFPQLFGEAEKIEAGGLGGHKVILETGPDILVPLVLLLPQNEKKVRATIVAVAQDGKASFLAERREEIAGLLSSGFAVCLPDLRDTGASAPGSDRGRYSAATARSSTALMLGQTMLGLKLHDLRSVISYLKSQDALAKAPIGIWGDSFAPVNEPEQKLRVPRRVDQRPAVSEPLGGMLACYAALLDDRVEAAYMHRSVSHFFSAIDSYQVLFPHDVVLPGMLAAADMPDVLATLAPTPVCVSAPVDALNVPLSEAKLNSLMAAVEDAYITRNAEQTLTITSDYRDPAEWFADAFRY